MNGPAPDSFGEFELIRTFFARCTARHPRTELGQGDDCALLRPEPDAVIALTTDTLVAGVHFYPDVRPEDLGHKSLAVNLSDLAAMGATPAWTALCLTLPSVDREWLAGFSRGFGTLAAQYGVELVGGDTTRGPLSVTVQALGHVPTGRGLRRSGARAGDRIYVTGTLGSAGLGLRMLQGRWRSEEGEPLVRLLRPEPRIEVGRHLLGYASACIDVSDGLSADLGHILVASGVGATLDWHRLPLSAAATDYVAQTGDWRLPLTAGDDYELCFTSPAESCCALEAELAKCDCPITPIGQIEDEAGLRVLLDGLTRAFESRGYDHFRTESP